MATKRGRSNVRKINDQIRSARVGKTGRGFGIDKGKYTSNAVGAQEPDPSAPSRASYSDTRRTPPALRKSDTPAKHRISKKKPKTQLEYEAKKKLEKDKTPQSAPTFNTNKPASSAKPVGSHRRVQPTVAAAKPSSSRDANHGSRPKRPDNWVSAADRKLIEGNPKKKKKSSFSTFMKDGVAKSRKKKRKAPTYRG